MGLSDRRDFAVDVSSVTEVIDFFVGSIEQWTKTLGLNSFTLIGHSFGGYIAANYTARFP